MKRVQEINREVLLHKIIEHSKSLLENSQFLSSNDWETDTLLLQCSDFLNRENLKKINENIT